MILFNEVIQIFRGTNFGSRGALMLFEDFTRRSMRSLITVERDLLRQSTSALERPPEKRFSGSDISLGTKQEIDRLSSLVDSAVKITSNGP
jgi:hypothetical protein